MATRTTIAVLCFIGFVVLRKVNAFPDKLEINIGKLQEDNAHQPVEQIADVEKLAEQNQEHVAVNNAEPANESSPAEIVKDANGGGQSLHNQEAAKPEVDGKNINAQQVNNVQHQEVEEDIITAEDVLSPEDAQGSVEDPLSSYNVKDTSGRSKYVNNQYIPDDLPSINQKPLFDLIQREVNQQRPPRPLSSSYSNVIPSVVYCDKDSESKEEHHFKLPKPTKLPNLYLKPIVQPLKDQTGHKGSIKYKKVSSSSQFVATPIANLLLKLEIGIAPASPSNEEGEEKDEFVENY